MIGFWGLLVVGELKFLFDFKVILCNNFSIPRSPSELSLLKSVTGD